MKGVQFARRMNYNLIGLRLFIESEEYPGKHIDNEAKLEQYVNKMFLSSCLLYCKMEKEDYPNAVLNSKFQVRGARNLRVVDASIFPLCHLFLLLYQFILLLKRHLM